MRLKLLAFLATVLVAMGVSSAAYANVAVAAEGAFDDRPVQFQASLKVGLSESQLHAQGGEADGVLKNGFGDTPLTEFTTCEIDGLPGDHVKVVGSKLVIEHKRSFDSSTTHLAVSYGQYPMTQTLENGVTTISIDLTSLADVGQDLPNVRSSALTRLLFYELTVDNETGKISSRNLANRLYVIKARGKTYLATDTSYMSGLSAYGSSEASAFRAMLNATCDPKDYLDNMSDEELTISSSVLKSIKKTTKKITAGCHTSGEKAYAIICWIGGNVKYLYDRKVVTDGSTAQYVFKKRTGICQGIAELYMVMCRCVGIPAMRFCGVDASPGGRHCWNAIYLDGQWRYAEPTAYACAYSADRPTRLISHGSFCPSPELFGMGHKADDSYWNEAVKVKSKKATYRVTSWKKATVKLVKAPRSKKSFVVPASVNVGGSKFSVAGIAKGAFANTKVKTVTLKTRSLSKKTVKNCFRNASKIKTVKVKVGSKAENKQYVRKYKKAFTKKNCGAKVSVK